MVPRGSGHIEAAKGGLQVHGAKLWIGLSLVTVLSFSVLGYRGAGNLSSIVSDPGTSGHSRRYRLIFNKQDILDGQNVWQAFGGQEVGSIWGHAYVMAPRFGLRDWLHFAKRMLVA
jgi:nitric oxide reductase subunit B